MRLRPSFSSVLLLLCLFLCPAVWSYEAPEDKRDVFASKACPAILTFTNAAFLAGVTVELPCHCKPEQIQSVVWFFKKHLDGSKETRALSDLHGNRVLDPDNVPHSGDLRSRFSIRLFSLLIFRAGPDDSGIYICGSSHKDFFYAYDLDVQDARTLSYAPRLNPGHSSEKKKEMKESGSARPLFRLFTSFRPWSVCDRCGVPGEQVRVGLCYVHSLYLHVRYRRANQTVTSCGSGAVPRAFGQLKESNGGAKLEVKSCQVTCQTQAPTPSSMARLMEFIGYKSSSLPVFHLSHPAGRFLTLGCPGARPNMAVGWDRGSEPIYRFEGASGRTVSTRPSRLHIDTGHHLLFQPAQIQDSGLYYCWLQGQKAAEIRLLVYAHLGKRQSVTSHPDFLIALKTVLTSYTIMTAIFCLLLLVKVQVQVHSRDFEGTHED